MTMEEKRVAFAAAVFARFVEKDDYERGKYDIRYLGKKIACAWELADKLARTEPIWQMQED